MNGKALIPMLFVLGSSSIAMARPVTVTGHAQATLTIGGAASTTAIVRDHRSYRPEVPPAADCMPSQSAWITLGGINRIVDGDMSFNVGRWGRQFSTLKLQSSAGKSLIYRVKVQFTNGRTQVVELNRYLNAANPSITIDLDGNWARSIAKVTVVGRNARQSAYSVLAI